MLQQAVAARFGNCKELYAWKISGDDNHLMSNPAFPSTGPALHARRSEEYHSSPTPPQAHAMQFQLHA